MSGFINNKKQIIQRRYEGYLSTACLWKNNKIPGLNPFKIEPIYAKINIELDDNLRLGKYVERLISYDLKQQEHISILAENIQIQQDQITLGELDFLILNNNQPIHLEVIYKFYLYDKSVGLTEIDHFIGPNRKDSLKEKLDKLKNKQLPILHTNACKQYLNKFDLQSENISQQVYFKSQLFLPYLEQNTDLKTLNNDCIAGFYIKKDELNQFRECKFYIPEKLDWLIVPHTNVNWLNNSDFETLANTYLNKEFSPLCWMKLKNGELKKFFYVWW